MSQKITIPKPVRISQSDKSALLGILGEHSCVQRQPVIVRKKKSEEKSEGIQKEPLLRDIPEHS